MRYYVLIRIQ